MTTNIIIKNDIVNQKDEKQLNYFSLNKRVFNELILTSRPKSVLFQIISYLACKATYINGLVGVHSEITKTGLAKELGINKGHITSYLEQLADLGFIRIFNTSPLVLQILEMPKIPQINNINALLLYVDTNPQLFNFQTNLNRKQAFFAVFPKMLATQPNVEMKKALVKEHKYIEKEPENFDPFDFNV
ncbi:MULTISPECIES: hypothetical protein [Comamonas]|uniref:hypothetical protein n=1 Tax=Comamonas TaxID=283 RepID=UPI00103D82A4|nr:MULTISPECIES: hypothetical protein [Comamonas]TFF63247.1 hypothetical protein EIC84_04170 [Comamonas sp. A23]